MIRININPDAQRTLQLEFTAVERMAIATTVTCHGTVASPAMRSHVLEHAPHLQRFADDIRSSHVVVEHAERRIEDYALGRRGQ